MKKYYSLMIFAILLSLVNVSVGMAAPSAVPARQEVTPPAPQGPRDSDSAALLTQQGATIVYNTKNRTANFIAAKPGQPIRSSAGTARSQSDAARSFVSQYSKLLGLTDQAQELTIKKEDLTDKARSFVRFQQVYQGIPVLGGELNVQLTNTNDLLSINGEILPDLKLSVSPAISADAAKQSAFDLVKKLYQLGNSRLLATDPKLWVYEPSLIGPAGAPTQLVWRVDVTTVDLQPVRELVLINAQTGGISLNFSQIDHALNRQTYTANNGSTLPGTLVCAEANPTCSGGDAHAVAAHKYAGNTYTFFSSVHGRDSIDNAGMILKSTVHYGSAYENAFWNGLQMVYGDGAGFPLADDVVAHELTHGVTEYTSGLYYYYQSGAINESFSDIWGEFVDQTNGAGTDTPAVKWQMGEDVTGWGAIRNLKDPTIFGDPDKMTSPNYNVTDSDSGGVHTNSGVNNKAAYLMTDGGTFNGYTVVGLGITKTAKIYYEVQTHLLTSGADYADLYNALYQGCINLVGTAGIVATDCQQVRNATNAVQMNLQPIAGYNVDAPVCPAGQIIKTTSFFGNMENIAGNWTFSALSGTSRWGTVIGYARSGIRSLYGNDYPSVVSDSVATMTNGVVIPAKGYLHFAHAYGFDAPNYDGGVLEYSANGGAWIDAGSLIQVNGYDAVISTGWSNPLGGRSAFAADSHGYISTRVNLASLAGQTVRFRWRMGLDSSVYGYGWFVDDVRIYDCAVQTTTVSISAQDGWVLESSETSNTGGTFNNSAVTIMLGDSAAKAQYRGILSFNTGVIPDTATITGVTLKVKQQSIVGTNPITALQGFIADIKNGYFGTVATLETGDFNSPPSGAYGPFSPASVSGVYSINLTNGRNFVNKLATNGSLTQIRLRFKLDDNNDAAANVLFLHSGNAVAAANRPQLVITYIVP